MPKTRISVLNPPSPPDRFSIKDTMGGLGQALLVKTGDQKKGQMRTVMPVLDLPYTAAVLRQHNIPFTVIDGVASFMGWDEILAQIIESAPEIVALRTSTPTVDWDLQVAKEIKERTSCQMILFGPHVAVAAEELSRHPFVDGLVMGECEMTLLETAQKGLGPDVSGLWFKDSAGKVVKNAKRGFIDDLDKLPFPAWDLMPIENFDSGVMRGHRPFVTMLGSRGCPHGCCYCPYPTSQGLKWRNRSPGNIADEMQWLSEKFGIKAVLFRDPEFGINKKRTLAICEEIIRRGIKIHWRCETRIENLTPEIIEALGKAGCIGINMGVESTSPKVLVSANRKPNYLDRAHETIKLCRKNGIETFCFFIIGLPGDTIWRALKTIWDALWWRPTAAQFTVATPYPGTALKVWAEEHGFLEERSTDKLTSAQAAMRNEAMTSGQILFLRRLASAAWTMRTQGILPILKTIAAKLRRAA